jgi:hypothetical protein
MNTYNFIWGVNKNIYVNVYTDMNFPFIQKYLNFVNEFFDSLEKIIQLNKDFCVTIDCKFFEYTQQIVFNSFLESEGVKNFYPETYYNENDSAHLVFFSKYRMLEKALKRFHFLNILYIYYSDENIFTREFYDTLEGFFVSNTSEKFKKYFNEEHFYANDYLEFDIDKEGFNFSKAICSDNNFYGFIVQTTEQ